MIYNRRAPDFHRRRAKCFDASTGEFVAFVFQYDTDTHQVGRYKLAASGLVVEVDEVTNRIVEIWETRPLQIEWNDGEVEEPADAAHVAEGNVCG